MTHSLADRHSQTSFGWMCEPLLWFTIMVAGCWHASILGAEPQLEVGYDVVPFAEGLSYPWGVAALPGRRFVVTEKAARIRIVGPDGNVGPPLQHGIDAVTLLDVAVLTHSPEQVQICCSYIGQNEVGVGLEVSCGVLQDNEIVNASIVFEAKEKSNAYFNYGGRMEFLSDASLLISVGDQGQAELAQNSLYHQGKLVRVSLNGVAPSDNPFIDEDYVLPEIYSFGHRNVQGIAVETRTGNIWASEHGPTGGDEINEIAAGANYGWPISSSGRDIPIIRSKGIFGQSLRDPILVWLEAIAPSGMIHYSGELFPEWRGDLFVAALIGKGLHRLSFSDGRLVKRHVMLEGMQLRMRDVVVGSDGRIYVLVDGESGSLISIQPKNQ